MQGQKFASAILIGLTASHAWASETVKNEEVKLAEINVVSQQGASTDPLSGGTRANEIHLDKQQLRKKASTLGNALGAEVGVHSNQFGGGASAPIIRGQEGVRLKILQNGLDVVDMSQLSPDHAIATDTLLAQNVEVVRGASTLLYATASQAGVINVVDKRIPSQRPVKGYEVEMGWRYNFNNKENISNLGFTIPLGKHLLLRAEGLKRQAQNYHVPEFNLGRQLNYVPDTFNKSKVGTLGLSWVGEQGFIGVAYNQRRDRYGLPGHNHQYDSCEADIFQSTNPTTFVNRYYLQAYPHLMDDQDIANMSQGPHFHCGSGHESDPKHSHAHPYGHKHSPDTPGPWVDMQSKRIEVKGEIKQPFAGVEKIRMSYAHSDYFHDEKEEEHVPVNIFNNKGRNLRLEIFHQPVAGFSGLIGAQYQRQISSANIPRLTQPPFKAGYTPTWKDRQINSYGRKKWALIENSNEQLSFFAMEQFRWRDFLFELSARTEKQRVSIDYDHDLLANLKTPARTGSIFDLFRPAGVKEDPDLSPNRQRATSYAGAIHWNFSPTQTLSLIASHNERVPTPMELYYHGNHSATNSFEYGNKNLRKEVSNNIEVAISQQSEAWNYNLSLYYSRFKNRIFNQTINKEGNLALNRQNQRPADYYGIEGKVDYQWNARTQIGIFGDYVRGKLHNPPPAYIRQSSFEVEAVEETGNAPRVPPARLGAHLDYQFSHNFSTDVRFTHVFPQNKVARLEQRTDGYNLLDIGLDYHNQWKEVEYSLFLDMNNLLNQKVYAHTSFLPYVPQMGRNIVLGLNLSF